MIRIISRVRCFLDENEAFIRLAFRIFIVVVLFRISSDDFIPDYGYELDSIERSLDEIQSDVSDIQRASLFSSP